MLSKALKILLISVGLVGIFETTAVAQDLEVFKKRMSEAVDMTKKNMDEALRMYLEIRAEYGGPEVDYSLGRAYHRLNQCSQAKQYYSAVMTYKLADNHPIYQRAVKAFDEISACETWQKYYLKCEIPEDSYVMIDDERVNVCWDRAYVMSPGEHVFKLISSDGRVVEEKRTAQVGGADEHITLKFPVEKISVERVVEKEHSYVLKDRFHPALYWGLIAGGAALIAGGGFFLGMANNAYAEEQKYADMYAVLGNEDYKQKASDARDKVKLGNALMYTFVGVGAAAAVSGIAIAIVNAVSEKERVEVENGVSAFVTPTPDGMSMGLGMRF